MKDVALVLCVFFLTVLVSCQNALIEKSAKSERSVFSTPERVEVAWKKTDDTEIQSYQTRVEIYVKNDRKDPVARLRQSYRLAAKSIDGKMYTRFDFDAKDKNQGRTIISGETEIVFLDPVSGRPRIRQPIKKSNLPFSQNFEKGINIGKVNIASVREEMRLRGIEITDDSSSNMVVDLPPEQIPQNSLEYVKHYRLTYNITNNTLSKIETARILKDGTLVTTTTTNIYRDQYYPKALHQNLLADTPLGFIAMDGYDHFGISQLLHRDLGVALDALRNNHPNIVVPIEYPVNMAAHAYFSAYKQMLYTAHRRKVNWLNLNSANNPNSSGGSL
jgi:hypothetical protein